MSTARIVVGVLVPVALAAGAVVAEAHAAAQLERSMTGVARALLPGGSIEAVTVTDTPALLAAARDRVQQTRVDGRTADGHRARVFIREFDPAAQRAESVSWSVRGLGLAPGWGVAAAADGQPDRLVTDVGGQHVEAAPKGRLEGSTIEVVTGAVTIDGSGPGLQRAVAAVSGARVAEAIEVPMPGAENVVGRVWFDGVQLGVEVSARDVAAGGGPP